ncbi:MAG: PQQ-dependent sugar dehydrogenase [Pirellulaceae bacterium]|nr:PQQ-dependent sugar dehydrogenase [Pirellulaceae bacterium]
MPDSIMVIAMVMPLVIRRPTRLLRWLSVCVACSCMGASALAQNADGTSANKSTVATVAKRAVPWTSSRISGTPEQPLPLSLEPVFENLKFTDPMHVRWQADTQRYFVCELGGKIWSFPHDPDVKQADLVVDLKAEIKSFDKDRSNGCENVYSIAFDPDFRKNRFVYVCMIFSNKTGKPLNDGSRISRFQVTESNPPTIDVSSELPIITWLSGGHNGCDLAFDNSGHLLFSTGDATAPSPPDGLQTGQDVSDLLSSVLRIDVRGATAAKPYTIPEDNPFQNAGNTRPEVWAFGFRNPWRIAIDPPTGQLWLGDVGWEKWELVHHVVRGGNYGWAVREGNELLQPNAPKGPGPILPTRVALPHADAASVTGGFVYRGQRLKEILGQYLFGDWITGRIWTVPLDEHSPHVEVASGQLRIIAFAPDRDGEPLVVNHLNGTTLFRLVPNRNYETELAATRNFPKQLSQTGLLEDVVDQQPAPGVRPFQINQPQWQDGAQSSHFLALPDYERVTVFNEPQPVGVLAMFNSRLHYPSGTVLAKTLTLPADKSKGRETLRKLETQLLHFDGRLWRGYSYLWNDAQTDANLVPASGAEITLPGSDGQRWRVHSRTECMQCHNPWPETSLAFTPEQLHRPELNDQSPWVQLVQEGFVITQDRNQKPLAPEKCVRKALLARDKHDSSGAARAYLHANCSHCHQNGAGAAVDISLRIQDEGAAMKAIDVTPLKGGFGIADSKLIAPGSATRSALLYRIASSSTGRMPHIGSREVDFARVALVADWINAMDSGTAAPKPGTATEPNNAELKMRAEKLLSELASLSLPAVSSPDGKSAAAPTIATNADSAVAGDSEAARSARLQSALALAIDLARMRISSTEHASKVPAWVEQLARVSDPLVSSLFEAHLPASQRQRRLGFNAIYDDVADLTGDAQRGQAYFFDASRSQCAKCHRVGERGGQVGPALSDIGKRLSPAQIFESIADPSRVIDPKFQSHIVVTTDGKVITGLLSAETTAHVTLVNAQGEQVKIATEDIESRKLDTKSLMPSGLAGELTAQQAADLLAYLSTLK